MNSKTQNLIKGTLNLLTAAFIFSTFGALTKIVAFDIPLYFQSLTRTLISLIILGVIIFVRKQWKNPTLRDSLWMMIRSIGGVLGYTMTYQALYHLTIGTGYFINYAGITIGSFVAGYFIFREKLTFLKLFSLMLALIGLFIIYHDSIQFNNSLYIIIDIIGGLGYAAWYTFSKKISNTYAAIQVNFMDMMFVSIITLTLSLLTHEQWTMPTLTTPWIASFVYGLIILIGGQAMIIGYKYIEAQIGTIIMLSEILFGIILGSLFFHESISIAAFFGGMFIVTAIALPEIRGINVKKK